MGCCANDDNDDDIQLTVIIKCSISLYHKECYANFMLQHTQRTDVTDVLRLVFL
jgi:hypothetical protein